MCFAVTLLRRAQRVNQFCQNFSSFFVFCWTFADSDRWLWWLWVGMIWDLFCFRIFRFYWKFIDFDIRFVSLRAYQMQLTSKILNSMKFASKHQITWEVTKNHPDIWEMSTSEFSKISLSSDIKYEIHHQPTLVFGDSSNNINHILRISSSQDPNSNLTATRRQSTHADSHPLESTRILLSFFYIFSSDDFVFRLLQVPLSIPLSCSLKACADCNGLRS